MEALILWIGSSILVAYWGRNRSVGPWGFLLFSLVFSPVVGALGLFVAGPRPGAAPPASDVVRLAFAIQSLQQSSMQQQALLDQVYTELKAARGDQSSRTSA